MVPKDQAEAAFSRVIQYSPTSALRKAAEAYWTAYNAGAAVDEKICDKFEKAVQGIPIDYRRPALECYDTFENRKVAGDDIADCYNSLALCISEKIIPLTGK